MMARFARDRRGDVHNETLAGIGQPVTGMIPFDMQPALRTHAKVLAGHKLEISAPELREGDTVEVIVMLPDRTVHGARPALEIIEGLNGRRVFSSPEEVDRSLQQERDSWDR